MTKAEVIEQLKDLVKDREALDNDDVWQRDIEALHYAINVLRAVHHGREVIDQC